MPIYEFGCPKCGGEEEFFLSIREKEELPQYCSKCKTLMKNHLSKTSVRKGAGIFSMDVSTESLGHYED